MWIRIQCPNCGQRIRAPLALSGKDAACKRCGTLVHLSESGDSAESSGPHAEQAARPAEVAREPAAPPVREGVDPTALPADGGRPIGEHSPRHPFEEAVDVGVVGGRFVVVEEHEAGVSPEIKARLAPVAIGYMVLGGLGYLFPLMHVARMIVSVDLPGDEGLGSILWALVWPGQFLMCIFNLVTGTVIVMGAARMMSLQSYPWAMIISIGGMVPFLSPWCCLGLPLGVWSLAVLADPVVKEEFREG